MSGRSHNGPKLDLKLNLSPPRANNEAAESGGSSSSEIASPKSSCVLSESDQEMRSMMVVGCRRCLMYVMLSDVDPKCPKCKTTVLLHVIPPRRQ